MKFNNHFANLVHSMINTVLKVHRIFTKIKRLRPNKLVTNFNFHNRNLFCPNQNLVSRKPIILMELNEMEAGHIAYSYVANVLAEKEKAKIVTYKSSETQTFIQDIKFRLKQLTGYSHFGVYKAFGCSEFFQIKITKKQKLIASKIFNEIAPQLTSKFDIVNLTINDIWIGDLLYDTYLRKKTLPTIEMNSKEFLEHLLNTIELYVFWKEYFKNNDIRAINVSHCVYNLAIPMRVAISQQIAAYQSSLSHIYRLDAKNYFAYNDFFYFREKFKDLSNEVQSLGVEKAKHQLERRFSGEVGVNMSYSKKSAYGNMQEKRLIRQTTRKKILIATHCFFDSPHPYGKNLFPDCYEWLNFLGEMSKETDYDWYIKTHPDFIPANKDIIEEFIEQNPKFVFLPPNASHHQIIKEGIDVALTIYGTIGFEYAALGVPVINASLCNPHIAYNFNIHPKTIEEYKGLILNLESLDFKIDQQEVYQYYFMRHLYNTENIFFDNYAKEIEKLGGYKEQFSPEIYQSWLAQYTPEKHKTINNALNKFISSGDFRMDNTHFGTEFLPEHIKE